MTRKRIAAAAVVALLSLAACSSGSQVGASSQTPVPSPSATGTATPTPSVSVSVSVSPGPTETVYTSSPEPSDEETTQAPDGDTVLIGKVVYVKLKKVGSGCDEMYATDVVLRVEDNDRGIRGVQYHDDAGEIGQGGSVGKRVRITVSPGNYHEITLEQGDEPFPASGSCIQGAVPDDLYGAPFLRDVTYNWATWKKLPAK